MKSLTSFSIFIWACLFFFSASAQNISVETATIKGQSLNKHFMHTLKRDILKISPVINNTIYILNRDGSKYNLTGFDATTMKQKVQFTMPGIKKHREDVFIEFTNDLISVWYFKKGDRATIYVNAYDYSGKPLIEEKAFHTFKDLSDKGKPYLTIQTSDNSKYLMMNNVISNGGGDYCIVLNSKLEKLWEKHIKFEPAHKDIRRNGAFLTNDGNILFNGFMADNEWVLLKGSPASDTYTQTASFGIAKTTQGRMISIKGDNVYFAGFYEDNGIERAGVYVAKINTARYSAEYLHYDKFTDDQLMGYSYIYEQSFPGSNAYHRNPSKITEELRKTLPSLEPNAIFIDESENAYLTFSDLNTYLVERTSSNGDTKSYQATENISLLQIIINNTGHIESFASMPLHQAHRSNQPNISYFKSIILGKNGKAFNIYNDDENSVNNRIRQSVVACDKQSLLAESHREGDKFARSIMLPEDQDVLIIPSLYRAFNSSAIFGIGTRDKGDLVLLKFSIN